jgi:hypothetical protein
MTILATLLGAGLIVFALREIFQQLFNPTGGGSMSRVLMRIVWRVFRRIAVYRPASLALAGPVTLLTVITTWSILLVVGWALVFWPRMPGEFLYASGLGDSGHGGFLEALYLSLVTLATLGYGDIVPTSAPLRVLVPFEALIGFGLFTAAVSWLLSIYPALSRRQVFAHEVTLIRESEREPGSAVRGVSADAADRLLASLTTQLVTVQGDLVQFPITYYFHSGDERYALPAVMPYLVRLAESADREDCAPEVRLRAAVLGAAIDDFTTIVASHFLELSSSPTDTVLKTYARDQLHAPRKGGQ